MNFKKKVSGSWVDAPYYLKGTDTETVTTLPTTIYPLGQSATIGLKGNTVQSGTPTPDNPIMPQGTGERTGNLWDNSSTISKKQTPLYYSANFGTPLPPDTYTFSAKVFGEEGINACRVSFRNSNMSQITASYIGVSSERTSIKVTLNEPCYAVYMFGGNDAVTFAAATYQDIMLNSGSTPLPYEPNGIKIPILCGNTTTPVYLGEVQSTRKIKKLVLTGKEAWERNQSSGSRYYFRLANAVTDGITGQVICSHYVSPEDAISANNTVEGIRIQDTSNYGRCLLVRTPNYTTDTVSDFTTFLSNQYAAGTPVTVWYVLAAPETGIVNEPLRKIGDYADTVSGITIPTIAGADTLSVGTTLQPSEVTVNYHGWHPDVVHERESGQWD